MLAKLVVSVDGRATRIESWKQLIELSDFAGIVHSFAPEFYAGGK